ncbi:MAG: hypothetical protein ACRD13_05250 [Terriglobales bacterium]
MSRRWALPAVLFACLSFAGCAHAHPVPHLRLRTQARHYMAGQEFLIQLTSSAPLPAHATVVVGLGPANGKTLWSQRLPASAAGRWSLDGQLPHPGAYRLSAAILGEDSSRTALSLLAIQPPPTYYGGVLPVATYGFPPGMTQVLRDHGFALRAGIGPSHPRLIAIAEPNLGSPASPPPGSPAQGPASLRARYRRIWQAVSAGTNLLLLSPPAADAAAYFPFHVHLVAYTDACGAAFPASLPELRSGLPAGGAAVLRPNFAYDLSQEPDIQLLTPDQGLLTRAPGGMGYGGCHAWFRFRFGQGLVTVSSVPVIAHGADAYVQRYVMNLLKLAALRPRRGHPAYGLAAHFLRQLRPSPPRR